MSERRRTTGVAWGAGGLALGIALTLAATTFDNRPDGPSTPTPPPVATAPIDPTPPPTPCVSSPPATEGVDPDVAWLPTDDIDAVLAHGDYPGQTDPETVLWGASVPCNGDPRPRHEDPAGAVLGVRRSFFQWRHRTTWLPEVTKVDLAAGRLPWVSIKPPPWEEVARGDHDDEVDQLLEGLRDLRGPVWLTVNHEPEGGGERGNVPDDPGGPAAHRAMNRRIRERMTALEIDNIALAPVLMSYTFNPDSGRDPDEWWEPDIYDFVGIDVYSRQEGPGQTAVWTAIREWSADRGKDIAVGEWGLLDTGGDVEASIQAWYDDAVSSDDDPGMARIVGLAYWDNESQSEEGWRLDGDRLTTFQDLLSAPPSSTWPEVVED